MDVLEATFKIVTPMFLGDAEREATSIRPPSVKGVLRFWWRALNWGRFYENNGKDETKALKTLHEEERDLFGSAAEYKNDRQVGGQGSFLLTVKQGKLTTTNKNTVHKEFAIKDAARYLGYGVIVPAGSRIQQPPTQSGQLIRSCINENQSFVVALLFKKNIDKSIVQAIKAMGLLGGLGSRTRRGYGSIALETIILNGKQLWVKPTNIEKYKESVKDLFKAPYANAGIPEPPYSAFFEDARIDCLVTGTSAYDVLNQFGHAMLMYRSHGRGGRVLGVASEKNFQDDHDWNEDKLTSSDPDFHPERVMFGLPHNYGENKKVLAENHERRASPLLLHVHQISSNEFTGISVYLPAKFLPDGENIKAGNKNVPYNPHRHTVPIIPSGYAVITDFIDGKDRKSPNVVTNRFPARQVIIP
jgi:CRISPR-associated protein Cmr1